MKLALLEILSLPAIHATNFDTDTSPVLDFVESLEPATPHEHVKINKPEAAKN